MKLIPCKKPIRKGWTRNYRILMEFMNSDMEVAEVEGFTQSTPYICASSLNNTIKLQYIGSVKAVVRNRKVYLIRLENSD